MNDFYIQIGVKMNQEELSQVKQDIERLVADVKKLMASDDKACCKSEEENVACHTKCGNHKKAWMCLGLTALGLGIAGVLIARKPSA